MSAEYYSALSVLDQIQNDKRDRETIKNEYKSPPNPVFTKGLTRVTTGSPQSVYCGGLLRATVRYFDPDRKRPGLPEDVSVLVDELRPDSVGLQFVSLNSRASRELIVQAGAFGEHSFSYIELPEGKGIKRKIPVNSKYFRICLPPFGYVRLKIGLRRFVNQPAYTHPAYV